MPSAVLNLLRLLGRINHRGILRVIGVQIVADRCTGRNPRATRSAADREGGEHPAGRFEGAALQEFPRVPRLGHRLAPDLVTEEQRQAWKEWVASRPPVVRDLARRLPPTLGRAGSTRLARPGFRVGLGRFSPDETRATCGARRSRIAVRRSSGSSRSSPASRGRRSRCRGSARRSSSCCRSGPGQSIRSPRRRRPSRSGSRRRLWQREPKRPHRVGYMLVPCQASDMFGMATETAAATRTPGVTVSLHPCPDGPGLLPPGAEVVLRLGAVGSGGHRRRSRLARPQALTSIERLSANATLCGAPSTQCRPVRRGQRRGEETWKAQAPASSHRQS